MHPSGLLVLGVVCAVGIAWLWATRRGPRRRIPPPPLRLARCWHPRTPDDCPACRAQECLPLPAGPSVRPVRPWREVKSGRGRRKRLATEGYACPARTCPYFGITDAQIHALVGNGHHGVTDRIQDYKCQACGTKVSARRGTALYHLKTPPHRVSEVLSALAEGLAVAAAVRVFGHGEDTITHWLDRAGAQAERLHERLFQGLHVPHIQLDEIRTRLRAHRDILWLWLAVDPLSKIVPVVHLGPRTQESAHALIHALKERLAPHCLPVITSDGLRLYYYALTAHFGQWVTDGRRRVWHVAEGLVYGQVKKIYRRRRLVRVSYRILCGTGAQLRAALPAVGLSGRLNTAFVERANLTIRHRVSALARRTWATAQTRPGLQRQLDWWRGYYHFVRPHHALRFALPTPRSRGGRREPQRYGVRTPAMAAGLTTRRWSTCELLSLPCWQPA